MLHSVALVRTDFSEEQTASVIRVTRFGELGTKLAPKSNRRALRRNNTCNVFRLLVRGKVLPSLPSLVTLIMEGLGSTETSVPTTATQSNIPEDDILHSHCRENLKSYIALTDWTL
jgi:hypothetical protein